MHQPDKNQVRAEVSRLLRELFQQHHKGANAATRARAHGYVDGFMRGLIEAGVFSHAELLALVRTQREHLAGPSVAIVPSEASADETANAA